MAISGHRNEASIRSYSANVSEQQTQRTSECLTLATADLRAVDVNERPGISHLQERPCSVILTFLLHPI